MGAISSAGTRVYISATLPATYNEAGYEALTWTAIGNIESVGDYGATFDAVTFDPLDTGVRMKAKGVKDNGDITLPFAYDSADAGVVILKAASDSMNDYSFKVVGQDGKADYFAGKVMAFTKSRGAVNDIYRGNATIAITSTSTGVGIIHDTTV